MVAERFTDVMSFIHFFQPMILVSLRLKVCERYLEKSKGMHGLLFSKISIVACIHSLHTTVRNIVYCPMISNACFIFTEAPGAS